jgi:hypothetical protein
MKQNAVMTYLGHRTNVCLNGLEKTTQIVNRLSGVVTKINSCSLTKCYRIGAGIAQ